MLRAAIRRRKAHPIHGVYLAGFFFTIHYSILAYVASSFLNQFISVRAVSVTFIVAAILSILVLTRLSNWLRKYGNFATTISVVVISALTLLGIVAFSKAALIISFFIIHEVLVSVVRVNFDIYIEELSKNAEVGRIRGIFLTIMNLSWVVSPLIVGFLITTGTDFWKIYILSFVLILISLLVVILRLKKIRDADYTRGQFWKTAVSVWQRPGVFKVFMVYFILNFFFSWMVIYLPIYLNQHIGFDWQQIGYILAIMLIPFILIELPLGWLADKKYGEKEFMLVGFIILAIATALLSFITIKSLLIWAAILFLTRVGAAAIDIMSVTYFYKKIDARDSNTIEFFADARSFSYILGPLLAGVFLTFIDIRFLWLVLGILVTSGLYFAGTLKDTL